MLTALRTPDRVRLPVNSDSLANGSKGHACREQTIVVHQYLLYYSSLDDYINRSDYL